MREEAARIMAIQRTDISNNIQQFVQNSDYKLPLFATKVSAGFPSPADDYLEGIIDLNRHLVKHPAATFLVRVTGDSMIEGGIYPGDILVVDRSLDAISGKVVIAAINNSLTVKRFYKKQGRVFLISENKNYESIELKEGLEMMIWGVVTNVIHTL